eukprot:jgi/Tetstr1/441510/TSEL_029741.t1
MSLKPPLFKTKRYGVKGTAVSARATVVESSPATTSAWQFCIDLHVLNTYCALKRLRMETLMGLRHPTNKGDGMFSFDLKDDFVALGIAPSD